MIKVKLFYMDGGTLNVSIASKDSQRFFDAISQHRFYFDDAKGRGFWTDIDKVRHMVVEEISDAIKTEEETTTSDHNENFSVEATKPENEPGSEEKKEAEETTTDEKKQKQFLEGLDAKSL